MDFLSAGFWSALLSIIIIDLVLAGDNAIVIGLAAKDLPGDQRKKVILWGTAGAIIIRAITTFAFVYLLKIPGLLLVGGLVLIWISYKLLTDEKKHDVKGGQSVGAAIRTIIIADAVMGIDNVLAVAGAAHGSYLLVTLGLIISIPIVVWGSTIILKYIDRFPIIIWIGSAILAWTAAKMIVKEPFLKPYFKDQWVVYAFEIAVVVIILAIAYFKGKMSGGRKTEPA
ncbi:TerC family protein [Metabacillus sp. GX 13764]|uniref:TerC family protein n=1 Tax=Metabacillus kandeliae TaxID=2900151 RepID=UPI001E399BCA|nr:TerC family protein [Metabacillus kandeliae]MCD7034807.1 TerC family protein [Metabacillus kandeliae]